MAMERCDLQAVKPPLRGFWQHLGGWLQRLGENLARWDRLSEQRRLLRQMDERLLKDIGLSQADVERIAGRRWFWDDPSVTGEQVDQRHRSSDGS